VKYTIHYTITSTFIEDVEAESEEDAKEELASILHRSVIQSLYDYELALDEISVKEIIANDNE
tara:strand:+ start:309 stop:497 length:189 start_codon:yes stop_codon:yes gene_type:complete